MYGYCSGLPLSGSELGGKEVTYFFLEIYATVGQSLEPRHKGSFN